MLPDEEDPDGFETGNIKKEINKTGYNGLDKMVLAV